MSGQIAVHFIGSKLYTSERFEEEAGKHGVARALPAFALRALAFGAPILLATFKGDARDHQPKVDGGAAIGEPWGTAAAFGYFILEGLNYQASDAFREWMRERLTIERVEDRGGATVERECGSYQTGLVFFISEDIPDILKLAEEWQASHPEERIKWFATGKFWPLAPHIRIEHVKFTRTIAKLDIEGWAGPISGGDRTHPLAFIFDYASRRYIPKSVACVCGKRHLKPEIGARHEERAKQRAAAKLAEVPA